MSTLSYCSQDAVAHLSRLGVVGEDVGGIVGGDSSVSSEGVEEMPEGSSSAQDFSEIEEVSQCLSM